MARRRKKLPDSRSDWLESEYDLAVTARAAAKKAGSHQAFNNLCRYVKDLADAIYAERDEKSQVWDAHDPEQVADVVTQLLARFGDHPRIRKAAKKLVG